MALGANHAITAVNVKLNPDPAWGTRTQNFQILGRDQASTTYTNLVSAANYQFVQGTNVVTIPVTATTADVRLRFNSNTGAPSGQVAELEVCGTPAPNPDLTVTQRDVDAGVAERDQRRSPCPPPCRTSGSAAAAATTVNFSLGGAVVGSATSSALAAGASTTVSVNAGTRPMGSYTVAAVVDPTNTIIEQNNGNNSFTAPSPTGGGPGARPGPAGPRHHLQPAEPGGRRGGHVHRGGEQPRHHRPPASPRSPGWRWAAPRSTPTRASIAAGATVNVAISGTWTATSGGATITATADATNVVAETNETNNSLSQSIVVGRGAAVPYVSYEAEAGTYQGTLLTADPLRTFGHTNFATESSGRQSVRLNSPGQFVEFTSTNQANSIVVRNSIPDAAGGGGIEATISLYINGTFDAEADPVLAAQLAVRHHRRPRGPDEHPAGRRPAAVRRVERAAGAVLPGRHEVQAAARRGRQRARSTSST